MIRISNHIGAVTVTRKYLHKLIADQTESCFGVAGLNRVDISEKNGSLSIKLGITAAGEVNLPAVAAAVSHKVAYTLTEKTGAAVAAVDVYVDDIML